MNIEEKRLYPRYQVSWQGNIVVNSETIDIRVGNICRGGLWFESPASLEIGQNYSVEVRVPVDNSFKTIRSFLSVVYLNETDAGNFEVGASVSLILPEDKPYFEDTIVRLSEENI